MENILKVSASLLTVLIVLSIYPALTLGWFTGPFFWIAYITGIAIDLWCINMLKRMQMGKNK